MFTIHYKRFSFPKLRVSLVIQPTTCAGVISSHLCHPVTIGLGKLVEENAGPSATVIAMNYKVLYF